MWQTYDYKRRKNQFFQFWNWNWKKIHMWGIHVSNSLRRASFWGSDKYLCIGDSDQNEVKVSNNNSFKETIELINISSGKPYKGHIFTVSMGY